MDELSLDMAGPTDKTELRVNISVDLMQRLDAVAQSKGFQTRGEWLVPVLEREIERELHAATLLLRMMRGKAGGSE